MKSFLKDFDDNFWKYMLVIILIIFVLFSIKLTNCVCKFSESAVRYFDSSKNSEHFTLDGLKKSVTDKEKSIQDNTTENIKKAQEKLKSTEEDDINSDMLKKLESTEENTEDNVKKAENTNKKENIESNIQNLKDEKSEISSNLSEKSNQNLIDASKKRQELNNKIELEESKLESFTSDIQSCEIKSPNNIVAGYMNSVDHDINDLCNNEYNNDCSLVKSSVVGGVQFIESRSLRKSNGEFSGVLEWTKQTQ